MCSTQVNSDDEARDFNAGDKLNFEIRVFEFNCESKTEFLNKFFEIRSMRSLPYSLPQGVPWSYAFSLLEDKYNRRNWLSEGGFYKSSEAVSGIYRQWQTGWVGGGMNILPQLLLGNSESVEKAKEPLILFSVLFNIRQVFFTEFTVIQSFTVTVLMTLKIKALQ